mgnify:CR=1 FL=1
MKDFYTYILQSSKDSSFYIGCTNDLIRRVSEHNAGMSKYTSKKIPWRLAYFEKFASLADARKRESFLKKQKNTSFYKRLISEFDSSQLVIPSTRDDC